MVKSMTGFGKGEAALRNKKITVEIRSLNSKQLDLSLRLPAVYRQSEYEIRNLIARTIQRGKVDVFVTVESQAVETSARINREVFREYLRQMNDTLSFSGIDAGYDAILPVIMRLPDVVATEAEAISEEEHAALLAAAADEGVPAPALCQPALSMLNTGALEELLPLRISTRSASRRAPS